MLDNNPDLNVKQHSNCASKYCLVKHKSQNQDPPSKQSSGQPKFNFQKLCVSTIFVLLEINSLTKKLTWKICVKNALINGGKMLSYNQLESLISSPQTIGIIRITKKICFFLLIKMGKTNLKNIILFCLTWYQKVP